MLVAPLVAIEVVDEDAGEAAAVTVIVTLLKDISLEQFIVE